MNKNIPNKLHIFINKKCNMNCKFCYWDEHPNEEMSLPIAEKIIQYVKNNPGRYDYIVFFGGEPMLSQDLILKFMKEIGRNMIYIVMTNGTINPINLLNQLYDKDKTPYNLCFTVSYEGFAQDSRKSGTNMIIEQTIKSIEQYPVWTTCTIASVMSPWNYKSIERNIPYFFKKVDTVILMRICNFINIWTDNSALKEHMASYNKIVDILSYLSIAKEKTTIIANRIDREIKNEGDNQNGTKAFFCHKTMRYTDIVGTDGKKYLCEAAFANGSHCYGYIWGAGDSEALDYNIEYPGVNHHFCLLYKTKSIDYDLFMDAKRRKFQKRKEKLLRLKEARKEYLESINPKLWRFANEYLREYK